MVEVARHERHVDVARLADRLAVVERLQHGQEALALLHEAGEGVEVARPDVAGRRRPAREGARRCRHGCVDVGRRALGDPGEHLAGGGVRDVEGVVARRREGAVDEVAEALPMGGEPGAHDVGGFGRGAVIHGVEDVPDLRHRGVLLRPSRGGRRSVAARRPVLDLPLDVGEQRGSADAEQVRLEPGAAQLLLHQDQPVQRVLGGLEAAGRLEPDPAPVRSP